MAKPINIQSTLPLEWNRAPDADGKGGFKFSLVKGDNIFDEDKVPARVMKELEHHVTHKTVFIYPLDAKALAAKKADEKKKADEEAAAEAKKAAQKQAAEDATAQAEADARAAQEAELAAMKNAQIVNAQRAAADVQAVAEAEVASLKGTPAATQESAGDAKA
jgi:colicin import membrane protein